MIQTRTGTRLRYVAVVGAAATAIGLGLGPWAGAARAAGSVGDPSAGAAYLVTQLAGGDHLDTTYNGATYANEGGTADLAIALAAAGTQDGPLAKVLAYLIAHTADYADPAGTAASYPGPYSGAVGKLAIVAEITGQNPRSFGGFDLLTALTSHVCSGPDTSGNCTAAGDFSQAYSTVSQALDVLALARAGVAPPAAAVTRLEQLQCTDGGFSSTLVTAGQACTSDVDTTGFAVQALSLVPAAATAVTSATHYLLSQQSADGGFTGAAGENVNSTALAVQALLAAPQVGDSATPATRDARAAGSATAIQAAQAYLAASQHADGAFGVHKSDTADDEIATAQAVPAVAGRTLTTLAHVVTPAAPTAAPPTTPPTTPTTTSPTSSPTPTPTETATAATPTATAPAPVAAAGGTLPYTGTSAGGWARVALGLLLAGLTAVLVAAGLRRRSGSLR